MLPGQGGSVEYHDFAHLRDLISDVRKKLRKTRVSENHQGIGVVYDVGRFVSCETVVHRDGRHSDLPAGVRERDDLGRVLAAPEHAGLKFDVERDKHMRQFVGAGFQFFEGPLGECSVGSIVDYGSFVRVALAEDGENVGHTGFPES